MFKQEFTVLPEESGQRIDALCARKFPHITRSRWTKYGKFVCNNIAKTPKTKTKSGQNWRVEVEEEVFIDSQISPWRKTLIILKETDNWVVIEKPYGISVHPSISEKSNKTIVNALVHLFGENLSENYDEVEGKRIPRPGIVHRLDKTTSGVLLVAKNNNTHAFFQAHWSEFTKTYYALVEGVPPQKGRIESGIIRDLHDRRKMMASDTEKAKWAITMFEKVEQRGSQALLKIEILTGRTHQIRVHLSSIGFPIVGDTLYGGPESERVMLHAQSLKFKDAENKEWIKVESELPF